MGRIPEETVEQVLAATDIVDVIGSYFPLKRAGSLYKACCPFHNEKTPSFTVNPGWQSFKCFGCGEGGSAIGFVMKYENLQFTDAVRKLAQKAGVTIIEEAVDPESERRRHLSTRLKELHNKAARYFHGLLLRDPAAQHARAYLKSRGFTKETAENWLIGWAPADSRKFLTWAKEKGFTGRELEKSGICGMKDANNPRRGLFVRFFDRLMFPIHNDYDDVVGFSARQLKEDKRSGKYINTPETVIFKKSKILFALPKARRAISREKFALLCEGQLDVIACHEAGLDHAVAGLGTAFTEEHARLLKRHTDHVTLCFDGDSAGIEAAGKAFVHLAGAALPVRLTQLPSGDDPDTFLKREGAEALRELIGSSKEFFDAKLDHDLKQAGSQSPNARAELLRQYAGLVSHISDDLQRDATIQNLSTRLRLPADDFRQAVHRSGREKRRFERRDDEPGSRATEPAPLDRNLAYLCHLALSSGEAAEYLCEQMETLYEVLDELPGGRILRRILARRPESGNTAAVLAFLTSFTPAEQLALTGGFSQDQPDDPVRAATDTVNLILSSHYQKKEASL
ncbi:MAG: DNA primase, partial [Verrucomicrobiales bacterium]